MSKKLGYKQVANVTRRTWDVEAYEKRAKDRAKSESSNSGRNRGDASAAVAGDSTKEEFTPAAAGAAGPYKSKRAFLKARQGKVDVDSRIGTVELVSPDAVATTSSISEASDSIKVRISPISLVSHVAGLV